MAFNKKSNLLECIFVSKKSLEISLNLTSQIKQLSLTHIVLIVTEPNLEVRSYNSPIKYTNGVLGPLSPALHILRCPCFSGVPGSNSFVESKQRSEVGKEEVLGGTKERSISTMRGLKGKSLIFYFSGPPNNYLIICDLPV